MGFLPTWGSYPRKIDGDSAESQSVCRSGPFKKVKLRQWEGGSWVTPPGSPTILIRQFDNVYRKDISNPVCSTTCLFF